MVVNGGSTASAQVTNRLEDHVYAITMIALSNTLPSTETTAGTAIKGVCSGEALNNSC